MFLDEQTGLERNEGMPMNSKNEFCPFILHDLLTDLRSSFSLLRYNIFHEPIPSIDQSAHVAVCAKNLVLFVSHLN